MASISSFNKSATNTAVSKTTFNFTNNIEKFVGSAANTDGRINNTEIIDFNSLTSDTNDSLLNKYSQFQSLYYQSVMYNTQIEMQIYSKIGATLATGIISITEGLLKFGEAIIDTFAILGSASAQANIMASNMNMQLYDNIFGTKYALSNEEINKICEEVQDSTKAFVSKEYVKNKFDSFYEENSVGQELKNNSFAFDTVRNVGNGIGYTGGVIATSIVTAPVSGLSIAASMGVVGATAGIGKNTEIAWNDGASYNEGIAYGVAEGAWEGAQYYLGGKINNFMPYEAGVTLSASQAALRNAGTHVLLDGLTGASEGIAQPLMQSLYKDGTYEELFQENGGWGSVVSQGVMAAGMSAFSEGIGLSKAIREQEIKLAESRMPTEIIPEIEIQQPVRSIGEIDDSLSVLKVETYEPPIKSWQFKDASVDVQIEYIKNGSLDDIIYVCSENQLDKKVNEAFVERIINNQNKIFTDVKSPSFFTNLLPIAENEQILSQLSTENLAILASKVTRGEHIPELVSNELLKRLENGEMIFTAFGRTKSLMMLSRNPVDDTFNTFCKQNPEALQKISDLYINEYKDVISDQMRDATNFADLPITKRLKIGEMSLGGRLDERSIEIALKMKESPSMFQSVDFRMLDKDIIDDFGEEFIVSYSRFGNITDEIVALKTEYPKIYNAYATMMRNASLDDSLGLMDIKVKNTLEFLYSNADNLKNIEHMDLVELQEYIDMQKLSGNPTNISFSNNFRTMTASEWDLKVSQLDLSSPTALKELKEAYLNKYFSMSLETAESLTKKYGTNLDRVLIDPDFSEAAIVISRINEIIESNDVTGIKNLYDEQNFRLSAEDMLHIDSSMQKAYVKTYVGALNETGKMIANSGIEMVPIEGTDLTAPVITLDGEDFSFLVYSSDTGFSPIAKRAPENFTTDYFNLRNGQTHGLSTSYITSDNIASAPVGDGGVMYGFTDISESQIREMGAQDINSQIAEVGYNSSVRQQYIMADEMSNHTTRLYNEFVLERDNVRPNCIILFSDASEEVQRNSLKAAADWSANGNIVPVIKIDVDQLGIQQIRKVNASIDAFKNTGDVSHLKDAIIQYESGASGFNLNLIGDYNQKHHNLHEGLIEIYKTCNIENECKAYAHEIIESGNEAQKKEFKLILEEIKKRYTNTNQRDNMVETLANTSSMIDIDAILAILGE